MKPEQNSKRLLGITQSKAKMYEYSVPLEHHIAIPRDPANLFPLTVGLLGDMAVRINGNCQEEAGIAGLAEDVRFAARFFDSYKQSRLENQADTYVTLLASTSYYLCGLPGSSHVLAKEIQLPCPGLGCLGLEDLLLWILRGNILEPLPARNGTYGEQIGNISRGLIQYFREGSGCYELLEHIATLSEIAYRNGTPRQLLFSDVISALVKERIKNSTWNCLPNYSNLPVESWRRVLQKRSFIRELWPAQQLLGKEGVFQGFSAVIQMPTSAGKTKSIEILLRSAFFSNRASRAVVIAPFKALCNEIRQSLVEAFKGEDVAINEFSDVLQNDFEVTELEGIQEVLVTTPEKLVYVLRYVPKLSETIGLMVFDEGHQFDNGLRGVTYELLLTSLKFLVPAGVQKVLISAVISNADAVNAWLNGTNGRVISGTNLSPMFRTVAFASWLDIRGRLEFITQDNPNEIEFFVPRVIEQHELQLRGKERNPQFFPEHEDGQTIALFLGLQLARNGSIAIFCGRKDTAAHLCEKVVAIYNRGLNIDKPLAFSENQEIQRLLHLHERNLGPNASATKCAGYGIFAHHGNTPHGLRLAVEYAMKHGLARFVICTSTLAQGVNLPIRYLIVTSVYQGQERIKVRDFQNLIGRAGRSGMHTEGSIIFADPKVFDKRFLRSDRWRWSQSIELLNPGKTEPCASTLLSIFDPFQSDDRKFFVDVNPLTFIQDYLAGKEQIEAFKDGVVQLHSTLGFTHDGMSSQLEWKSGILATIESFLMAQWDIGEKTLSATEAADLAQGTLAYSLANETQRTQLVELFSLLAQNIQHKITEAARRKAYAKTLLGVSEIIDIEKWVHEHIDQLNVQSNHEQLLTTIWPIISQNAKNRIIQQCEPKDALLRLALSWIDGWPFFELHADLKTSNVRLVTRSRSREIKLEQVVDFCENGLGYKGTLLIGAIIEIISMMQPQDHNILLGKLQVLQKRLKYGLPSMVSVNIYEIGFSDRVISLELSIPLSGVESDKRSIREGIRRLQEKLKTILSLYPSYYSEVLDELL